MANINLPAIPNGIVSNEFLRRWMTAVEQTLRGLNPSLSAPDDPSNLRVTPCAGGNIVTFTRSANADTFIVYWGATADFGKATAVDIGLAQQWTDAVGAGAITRYYWVKAKVGNQNSNIVGPQVGVTLALGTAITPVKPPIASDVLVTNDQGDVVPASKGQGRYDYI